MRKVIKLLSSTVSRFMFVGIMLNLSASLVFTILHILGLEPFFSSMVSSAVVFPIYALLQAKYVHSSENTKWKQWAALYLFMAFGLAMTTEVASLNQQISLTGFYLVSLGFWSCVSFLLGRQISRGGLQSNT